MVAFGGHRPHPGSWPGLSLRLCFYQTNTWFPPSSRGMRIALAEPSRSGVRWGQRHRLGIGMDGRERSGSLDLMASGAKDRDLSAEPAPETLGGWWPGSRVAGRCLVILARWQRLRWW